MSVTEVFTLIRHLIDYEAPKQDGHDETTSGRRQLCAVLIVALSYYYRYFMHLEYKAMFIISSQNEHKSFIKNKCACLNYQAILHSKRGEKYALIYPIIVYIICLYYRWCFLRICQRC